MEKLKILFFILILSITANTAFAAADKTDTTSQINWIDYSPSAFETAKKVNKLVLVFGMADACHWCHEMIKTTFKDKNIINLIETNYLPVMLHADLDIETTDKYEITGLPVYLILNQDGKKLGEESGFKTVDEMKAILEKKYN